MARHVELLSQFSSKCNAGSFDLTQSVLILQCSLLIFQSDIVLLLQAFLKIADISNPLRQWSDSEKWAEAVMQEFFLQGDQEKRLGLPISPFMVLLSLFQFLIVYRIELPRKLLNVK